MPEKEQKIFNYACRLFQESKYDEALDIFIFLYNAGYERKCIIETIYNCYVSGNEETFRESFEKLNIVGRYYDYEECLLDFIPYKEGEYYIFDKELLDFVGIFSIKELENTEMDEALLEAEFSPVALKIEWDWNKVKRILTAAKERKIYAVCDDIRRAVSYCKIPELADYMENVTMFENWEEYQAYFHKNTEMYLPKVFCGSEENRKRFREILHQEHAYRLTPEGRNTDNILLTIAIPTANRGHLLLKRMENLLQMQYDSEIEISVSKNGIRFFEDEYKKVGQIPDARINYYDHGRELKYNVNWSYAIEMSHGKYVLLVSDEDDVIIGALEHYMKLLSTYSDLSLARARTNEQYSSIRERVYGKKGVEAFECEFLIQNYISGLIVNREIFLQENLLELERFSENPFYQYYPHEWWCAMLSLRGDYIQEPVSLIAEGNSILVEEIKRYRDEGIIENDEGTVGNTAFPQYSTYEARLAQFKGQVEFLHFFCNNNREMEAVGLKSAIDKTAYLLEMARAYKYDCENYINMINRFVDICIEVIQESHLDTIKKKELLLYVSAWCTDLIKLDERLNNENIDNRC